MDSETSLKAANVFVSMYDKYVAALTLAAKLEADLKKELANIREIEQREFPALMQQYGMTEYVAYDGYRILLKDEVYASLKGDKLAAATPWLVERGLGSIIKRKFTVLFGRDEDKRAAEFAQLIGGDEWDVADEPSIHPQTLKANIRELLAEGVEVPLDLLGATVVTEVSRRKS